MDRGERSEITQLDQSEESWQRLEHRSPSSPRVYGSRDRTSRRIAAFSARGGRDGGVRAEACQRKVGGAVPTSDRATVSAAGGAGESTLRASRIQAGVEELEVGWSWTSGKSLAWCCNSVPVK